MQPANQFRALEEDEIMFLDSVREKQEEEERQRKEKDGEEVRNFKECVANCLTPPPGLMSRRAVAARTSAVNNPPPLSSNLPTKPTGQTKAAPLPIIRKDLKKALKGVVVKRKAKTTPAVEVTPGAANRETKDDSDRQPDAKRRKV
jgi:hypothetical protein